MSLDYEKLMPCMDRTDNGKVYSFDNLAKYDSEKLKTRFIYMSDSEVMEEYAFIVNSIKYLDALIGCSIISESEYFAYVEPLSDVEYFISRYLAVKYMLDNGYMYGKSAENCKDSGLRSSVCQPSAVM